jgi:repressor of nif and glnA expression
MKNIVKKYQFIKIELTVRSENENKDENYILEKLGFSSSKIHESIYLTQYRYR